MILTEDEIQKGREKEGEWGSYVWSKNSWSIVGWFEKGKKIKTFGR